MRLYLLIKNMICDKACFHNFGINLKEYLAISTYIYIDFKYLHTIQILSIYINTAIFLK